MKRAIVGSLIGAVVAVALIVAAHATIEEDMDAIVEYQQSANAAIAAKVALQNLRNVLDETVTRLDAIEEGSSFAGVPASVKAELVTLRNGAVSLKGLYDQPAHKAFLDYSPPKD